MSISDSIAPHIPFLRRFARALCGTQAAGDAYVAATLEAILADPDCFDAELDPKVALYKLFLRSWRNVPLNDHVDLRGFRGRKRRKQKSRRHLSRAAHGLPPERCRVFQPEGDCANHGLLRRLKRLTLLSARDVKFPNKFARRC